ncbi:MAG TPA: hypothetical protein GXX72_06955 [Clostridiaceae bacterium]|nr:hypothetical protein [Clostridiaceae bacterium]
MKLSLDFSRQDEGFLPNFGTSRCYPRFVIAGLGGTGGYVFYHLARLIAAQENSKHYQILLADGDIVEKKNLIRQNFIEEDVGRSKVKVLSERYGYVYKMNIPYHSHYIEDQEVLNDLLWERKLDFYPTVTVLIGCVDNNKTRQLFYQTFMDFPDLMIYIDSGNDEWSGQVVMGAKGRKKIILPPVGYYYPDILEDTDTLFPSEESCQDIAVSSPQNIATNITAATITFTILNQLFFNGGTEIYGATFNATTGQTRALRVEEYYKKQKNLDYPYQITN